MKKKSDALQKDVTAVVSLALQEDIGTGCLSCELIDIKHTSTATLRSKEPAIFCGRPWVDETFLQVDKNTTLNWLVSDGDKIKTNQPLVEIKGNTRSILMAERTAINFAQTLSGTATVVNEWVQLIKEYPVKLLDTRKTLPGLRRAQKYAVICGGGHNHRMGLYDALLIKENHIAACGGIAKAIDKVRQLFPNKTLEIEVETIDELNIALTKNPDIILCDNFSTENLKKAVALRNNNTLLEASGNINKKNIEAIAQTKIDCIAIGALTKNIKAVDLSLVIDKV